MWALQTLQKQPCCVIKFHRETVIIAIMLSINTKLKISGPRSKYRGSFSMQKTFSVSWESGSGPSRKDLQCSKTIPGSVSIFCWFFLVDADWSRIPSLPTWTHISQIFVKTQVSSMVIKIAVENPIINNLICLCVNIWRILSYQWIIHDSTNEFEEICPWKISIALCILWHCAAHVLAQASMICESFGVVPSIID